LRVCPDAPLHLAGGAIVMRDTTLIEAATRESQVPVPVTYRPCSVIWTADGSPPGSW